MDEERSQWSAPSLKSAYSIVRVWPTVCNTSSSRKRDRSNGGEDGRWPEPMVPGHFPPSRSVPGPSEYRQRIYDRWIEVLPKQYSDGDRSVSGNGEKERKNSRPEPFEPLVAGIASSE